MATRNIKEPQINFWYKVPPRLDPKYHKLVLRDEVKNMLKDAFSEIAINNGFEIDKMEVGKDYVHLFLSSSPRYSISTVMQCLKVLVLVEYSKSTRK